MIAVRGKLDDLFEPTEPDSAISSETADAVALLLIELAEQDEAEGVDVGSAETEQTRMET